MVSSGSSSGVSSPVRSSQVGPHEGLRRVVERGLRHPWRGPVPVHQTTAYARLVGLNAVSPRPLVLDAGCGTGRSTWALARRHPDHLVVGVDKSVARLSRGRSVPDKPDGQSAPLWLRMDLGWLWRLLAHDRVRAARQLLLYPNPWPKPGQLRRRWHAHPAFGAMLAVGGQLELRTNWWIYAEEMRLALWVVGRRAVIDRLPPTTDDLTTAFEHKYRASGHPLWRLRCDLDADQVRSSSTSPSTATS